MKHRAIYSIFSSFSAVLVVAAVFLITFLASANVASADYAWTEQTGSGQHAWKQIALSSDGSRAVAIESVTGVNTLMYISTDSGITWNASTAGAKKWTGVASSDNGMNLVAVADGDTIYTSTDGGDTWTPRDSARGWNSVTSSSDGQYLAATVWNGNIYTSNDSGAAWTPRDIARNWTAVTSSPSGAKLAAVTYGGNDPVYTSTDSGATWAAQTNSGSGCWSFLTTFSSGSGLAVGDCNSGYVYISTDSGANWTNNSNASGQGTWYAIASSANGDVLAAANHNNALLKVSTDTGASWQDQNDPGQKDWSYVVASADSEMIYAAANGSNIFTGVKVIPPPVYVVSTSTVTVFTLVTNNDGGTATSSDFTVSVSASGTSATTLNGSSIGSDIIFDAGLYDIVGSATSSYTMATSTGCQGSILAGATSTCTILYDDIAVIVIVPPPIVSTSTTSTSTATTTTTATTTVSSDDDEIAADGSRSGTSRRSLTSMVTSASSIGSAAGSVSGGSSGGSGSIIGSCSLIANLRPGSESSEVTKLQEMLNKFVAANITPNGFYGPATKDAVKAFQNKYSDETLAPWGVTEATGIVSFTTLKKLNELNCGEQFELSPLEKYLINQFKNNPAPVTPEGTSTSTTPEGTAVPIEVGAAPRTPLDENDIQTASVIDTGVTGSLFKKIGDFFKKNF